MDADRGPEAGDVRLSDSGEVEVFDGTSWSPYRRLSDESGVVYRFGPGAPDTEPHE
jgi:hypothetical protein